MYVCGSDWFTQYDPVKHWVKRKSTSHPPHQISLCLLLPSWNLKSNVTPLHVLRNTRFPRHRHSQGGRGAMAPQIFRKYSHFVLWETVFQTKQCYSPEITCFAPPNLLALPKFFGWLRHCSAEPMLENTELDYISIHTRKSILTSTNPTTHLLDLPRNVF